MPSNPCVSLQATWQSVLAPPRQAARRLADVKACLRASGFPCQSLTKLLQLTCGLHLRVKTPTSKKRGGPHATIQAEGWLKLNTSIWAGIRSFGPVVARPGNLAVYNTLPLVLKLQVLVVTCFVFDTSTCADFPLAQVAAKLGALPSLEEACMPQHFSK